MIFSGLYGAGSGPGRKEQNNEIRRSKIWHSMGGRSCGSMAGLRTFGLLNAGTVNDDVPTDDAFGHGTVELVFQPRRNVGRHNSVGAPRGLFRLVCRGHLQRAEQVSNGNGKLTIPGITYSADPGTSSGSVAETEQKNSDDNT